jgi:hypothetical protein
MVQVPNPSPRWPLPGAGPGPGGARPADGGPAAARGRRVAVTVHGWHYAAHCQWQRRRFAVPTAGGAP